MYKVVCSLIIAVVFALPANASDSRKNKTFDGKFIFVSTFLISSTVFDAESTFAALNNCSTCYEANGIMRPFVENGRVATYAVYGTVDAGVILISYKLKKDGYRLWWLPAVIGGIVHTTAGGLNLRYAF